MLSNTLRADIKQCVRGHPWAVELHAGIKFRALSPHTHKKRDTAKTKAVFQRICTWILELSEYDE